MDTIVASCISNASFTITRCPNLEGMVAGSFPRIDAVGNLAPGSDYKDVTLLDGWLLEAVENMGKDRLFTWKMRGVDDIKDDHVQFARDLLASVVPLVQSVISGGHIRILEVFDALSLVELVHLETE